MQKSVLARILSIRQSSIYIVLLILLFNLFSGNLLAENIEYSEFPVHGRPIFQTSTESTMDNYDVTFYDIDLKVKDGAEDGIIQGTVSLKARILDASVIEIQINLADNMTVYSVSNESGELSYNHENDLITITLEKTYSKDEIVTINTEYGGTPESCVFQGFSVNYDPDKIGHKVIATLSQPECARTWWPCKDQVYDKADTYKIAVQTDTGLFCVSNGKLDSTVAVGDTALTFYYSEGHPMTTYNFALAISDYHIWDDQWWYYNNDQDSMPIVNYVYGIFDNASRKKQWSITSDVLTFLSDLFGQYPFADEKYGHALYYAGVAMEHQTISFMPGITNVFDYPKYLVHELAHQWWGNMITCKTWNDLWIQEGMATYAEALYFEKIGNGNKDKFRQHMENKRCEKADRSIYLDDVTDIDALFDTVYTYNKSAWVFHMLRKKLGDDLFRGALHAFYNSDFKYGSITTDEFIDFFGNAVQVDLHKFLDQWVKGKGFPIYEWSYWQGPPNPNGDRNIYLYVEQTQETDPEIFEMPVDFVFYYENKQLDTVTLEINDKINRHVVKVRDAVDSVILDPMNWVLQKNTNIDWRMRIVTEYVPGIPDIALDTGVVGSEYEDTILTSNNETNWPEYFRISGDLPPGLSLRPDGVIQGTCLNVGDYNFLVEAKYTNQNDNVISDTLPLTLTILPLPEDYALYQNYPNPFNNETMIVFDLPRPGYTTIEIYNVLGQKVKTLIDGYYFAANNYHVGWQGENDLGNNVATGIYLYRLKSGDFTLTRKMVLLK